MKLTDNTISTHFDWMALRRDRQSHVQQPYPETDGMASGASKSDPRPCKRQRLRRLLTASHASLRRCPSKPRLQRLSCYTGEEQHNE